MVKKVKWNFAVVKSIFGNLWIGKTKLAPVKDKVFTDLSEAIEKAQGLFMEDHIDFDPSLVEDDEFYDCELEVEYNELEMTTEEDAEEIKKDLERFIVGGG